MYVGAPGSAPDIHGGRQDQARRLVTLLFVLLCVYGCVAPFVRGFRAPATQVGCVQKCQREG